MKDSFKNWIRSLWLTFQVLLNQKGEVPDTQPEPDTGGSEIETPMTEPAPEVPTEGEAPPPDLAAKQESFYDPAQLPPELKAIYGKMQSSYQKAMNKTRGLAEKATIVDRFNSDPQFARETIVQAASRLGYQLVPLGGQANGTSVASPTQSNGQINPQFVDTIKQHLPSEVSWLADSLAPGLQVAVQSMIQPLLEKLQQTSEEERKQQRSSQFDEIVAELGEKHPGWEENEDDMNELWQFLSSDRMKHPKFGNKLELLYNATTNFARSTAQAADRMRSAVKNKSSSSKSPSTSGTNIIDRIKQTKSSSEAFQLAGKHAQEELRRQGKL